MSSWDSAHRLLREEQSVRGILYLAAAVAAGIYYAVQGQLLLALAVLMGIVLYMVARRYVAGRGREPDA